jgi:uncharacterized protein (DUF1499 family)
MAITRKPVKKEKADKVFTLNKALLILREKKIGITEMGLRTAAVRDGFRSVHTGSGKEKFQLDEVKFRKWIKTAFESVPAGLKAVPKAAKELNITPSYVYALIKKNNIKTRIIGAGRGKVYVDFQELKNVFNGKTGEAQ